MAENAAFQEKHLWSTPIRDLGLAIAGTGLEPVIAEFQRELEAAGIRKLRLACYLSDEWGVNFNTIAIGIPFYLAQPELKELHANRVGYLEGAGRAEILRYLRHEMGHVVNYGYRLYEQEDWVKLFGSITQPYAEEYKPQPFSRRFVRHLPGWYAQKHPDEDWAETFAVWMTHGLDWRGEYKDWPTALAKLEYCDRPMQALKDREPEVTSTEPDQEVSQIGYSLDQFYRSAESAEKGSMPLPAGLDGALQTIFEDLEESEAGAATETKHLPAANLIRRLERELTANVFRWTGQFPERARPLLRYLASRAEALRQVYPADREQQAVIAVTTLVTALAMNYVQHGSYMP
jgi:hypothetical protein